MERILYATPPHKKALLFCVGAVLCAATLLVSPHVARADVLNNGLVGRWTFENKDMSPNVRDVSGQGTHGSLSGFTSTTTATGKIGTKALNFNGTNNLVRIPNTVAINSIGTSIVTVSAWIYVNAASLSENKIIFSSWGGANAGYQLYVLSDGKIGAWSGSPGFTPGPAIDFKKWHHVAMVYNGTTVTIYVDGVSQGSTAKTFTTSTLENQIGTECSGANSTSCDEFFPGYIDDVRVYNRALSASEMRQLYVFRERSRINSTNTATPNLKDGLVSHWTFDGKDMYSSVRDASGNGYDGTLSASAPTKVVGKVGQALSFNGTNNYITGSAAPWTSQTTSYTVSAWVKPAISTGNHYVLSWRQSSDSQVMYQLDFNVGDYRFIVATSTGATAGVTVASSVVVNKWTHLVGVRTGNSISFYINGVLRGTDSSQTLGNVSVPGGIYPRVGAQSAGLDAYWSGLIDDARLYTRALSAQEVKLLYTATSPGKTNVSPALPKVGAGGLVGWWTFDGNQMSPNVRDKSGQANHGTLSGFTSTTTRPGKIGQALTFDGVNDTVSVGTTGLPSGNSARSVSLWAYVPTTASNIFFGYGQAGVNNTFGIFRESGRIKLWGYGFANDYDTGYDLPTNKWVLLTVVHDGTNRSLYVNGSFYVQQAWTYNTIVSSAYIGSEFASQNWLNGIVDDVRVYNKALSAAEVKQLYLSARSFVR